jgi:hypothetical protein
MVHLAYNNHCTHKEFLLTADKPSAFQKLLHSYGLVQTTSIRRASGYCGTYAAEITTKQIFHLIHSFRKKQAQLNKVI